MVGSASMVTSSWESTGGSAPKSLEWVIADSCSGRKLVICWARCIKWVGCDVDGGNEEEWGDRPKEEDTEDTPSLERGRDAKEGTSRDSTGAVTLDSTGTETGAVEDEVGADGAMDETADPPLKWLGRDCWYEWGKRAVKVLLDEWELGLSILWSCENVRTWWSKVWCTETVRTWWSVSSGKMGPGNDVGSNEGGGSSNVESWGKWLTNTVSIKEEWWD